MYFSYIRPNLISNQAIAVNKWLTISNIQPHRSVWKILYNIFWTIYQNEYFDTQIYDPEIQLLINGCKVADDFFWVNIFHFVHREQMHFVKKYKTPYEELISIFINVSRNRGCWRQAKGYFNRKVGTAWGVVKSMSEPNFRRNLYFIWPYFDGLYNCE